MTSVMLFVPFFCISTLQSTQFMRLLYSDLIFFEWAEELDIFYQYHTATVEQCPVTCSCCFQSLPCRNPERHPCRGSTFLSLCPVEWIGILIYKYRNIHEGAREIFYQEILSISNSLASGHTRRNSVRGSLERGSRRKHQMWPGILLK